jgi:hypothetical protein
MLAELGRRANRVSQAQDTLRTETQDNADAIAATIGELDQRLPSQSREIIAPSTAKTAANLDSRP